MTPETGTQLRIVLAGPPDAAELARLLWRHAAPQERDAQPVESFTRDLVAWWSDHDASHVAFLARRGSRAVGMAWLAVTARPPRPGAVERRSADVQSVFVEPGARGAGVGAALVRAATDHAWRHGIERVTVSSSTRAVPMYERLGFGSSRELLQLTAPSTDSQQRR